MKISDYPNERLNGFLKELGSASPAPGGGAAAALTAALGTALVEMVARLNKDLPTAKKTEQLKKRLQALMVADAKAFKKIYALYKKKTSCCSPGYQKALANAAGAPEEMCLLAAQAAELAVSQKKKTSQWLMSDLKEAVILLKASFESARFNVNVNLKGFHDHGAAKKIDGRLNKEYARLMKNGRRILD